MYANYKINLSTISATTATTINIPISIEYQIVDTAELIESTFIELETERAINPILDYDKARFIPRHQAIDIDKIVYMIDFLSTGNTMQIPTYYSDIGFDDQDIRLRRNYFKESHIYLGFFDTDNPMTQTLVSEIDIYNALTVDDLYPSGTTRPNIAGQPKPATQIPVRFVLSNPLKFKTGGYEGYHIYTYKNNYVIGMPKYLYMKAFYFNAKTGKSINLMTEPIQYKINDLINKLYTRYKLYRDTTGFYYEIDDAYSTNVVYAQNGNNWDVIINLYQIQTL